MSQRPSSKGSSTREPSTRERQGSEYSAGRRETLQSGRSIPDHQASDTYQPGREPSSPPYISPYSSQPSQYLSVPTLPSRRTPSPGPSTAGEGWQRASNAPSAPMSSYSGGSSQDDTTYSSPPARQYTFVTSSMMNNPRNISQVCFPVISLSPTVALLLAICCFARVAAAAEARHIRLCHRAASRSNWRRLAHSKYDRSATSARSNTIHLIRMRQIMPNQDGFHFVFESPTEAFIPRLYRRGECDE